MQFYNYLYHFPHALLGALKLFIYSDKIVFSQIKTRAIICLILSTTYLPLSANAETTENTTHPENLSADEHNNIPAVKLLKKAKSFKYSDPQKSTALAKQALNKANTDGLDSISAQSHSLLGKLAQSEKDYDQAIFHFVKASVIFKNAGDPRRQISSSIHYIKMLVANKRYVQATVISDELLPIAIEYGDSSLISQIFLAMGDSYYKQKHYEKAISQYIEALSYLPENDKSLHKEIGEVYKKIALSYKRLKDAEQTAYYYKKALNIYTSLGDKRLMAQTLNTIAEAERSLGNLVVSLEYSIRSLDIYNQIDEPEGKNKALGAAGITYRLLGRYEKSLEHIYETHLYYKRIKSIAGIAESSNQMGLLYMRLKQYDQARSFYQVTINLPEDKIEVMTLASALRELSVLELKEGDFDSALKMAQRAKSIYKNENEKAKESIATRIIANIYAAQNKDNQAIAYYRESLMLAKQTDIKYIIKAQTPLAISLIGKDTNEAVSLLLESLALSKESKNQEQTLFAYRALKQAEKERNNINESLRYAEEEIILIKKLHQEKDKNKLVQAKAALNSHRLEVELKALKEKARVDQLELTRKNNEIEIAEQANTINELELVKNRYATIALSSLLVACIFLVIYIYRRFADSKRKNLELDYLATHDPLTNCYNRRVLFEMMNRDFLDTGLLGEYCVMMIDIDHFKDVNDTHGHNAGDVVICGVAKILQDSIRKNDIAARYGGEEFCIVLPGAAQEQAMIIAENMRKEVEKSNFENIQVTCSFGITSIKHNAKSPQSLIEQADLALYRSKSQGRNQVTVWNETITKPD